MKGSENSETRRIAEQGESVGGFLEKGLRDQGPVSIPSIEYVSKY
jgi:hypothetical protein